jgi:hypothetical protein
MRATFAAASLLALLLAGAAPASPVTVNDVRSENRQLILTQLDPEWDASDEVTVVTATLAGFTEAKVPADVALELQLDFLDENGIRLADLMHPVGPPQVGGSENPQPNWPALGSLTMYESGWFTPRTGEEGARCPRAWVDAPAEAVAAYNQQTGRSALGLAVFTSTVSEFWQRTYDDGTTAEYASRIKFTPPGGSETTYTYGGKPGTASYTHTVKEGWTTAVGLETHDAPDSRRVLFCQEWDPATTGLNLVDLTAKFQPVSRTCPNDSSRSATLYAFAWRYDYVATTAPGGTAVAGC